MKRFFSVFVLLLFVGMISYAQQGNLKVEDFAFCTGVENRTPVGTDSVFASDVGHVYTFTKIVGATEPTTIAHVYYYNGKEMARIELKIGGSPWRTWSSKTILPEWKGEWKVEIVDGEGNVLKTGSFKIE
jgi:hypothetical protein